WLRAAIASRCSVRMASCLTLYSPVTCLTMSSESPTTSTSAAPSSRARARPSRSARYSATLLVAGPSSCTCSASRSPCGELITLAAAAGPGFPRAPPSTCTTTFIPLRPGGLDGSGVSCRALVAGLLDDLLSEMPRHLLVAQELERVVALASGDRAQVGRVGEHLRHRHLCLDLGHRSHRLH